MTYDPAASYKIINRKSGKALSLHTAGSANGSPAILFEFVNAEDQLWHVVDLGDGHYKLLNNHSGRALSTLAGGQAEGTIIHIWDYLTTFPDQHWVIEPLTFGAVKITNKTKAMAVSCLNGGTDDDTAICLSKYNPESDHQNWRLVPVTQHVAVDASVVISHISPYMTGACLEDVNHQVYGGIYSQMIYGESFQEPPPVYEANAPYKIINRKSGRALSVLKAGANDNTPAILYDFVDAPDQSWRIVDIGDGFYKLINHRSGRALSTLDGASGNGAIVHIHEYLSTFPDQHWAISPGVGFVRITNRTSRRALSCVNGGATNETAIHLGDYVGGAEDQEWLITLADAPVAYDPTASYKILNKKSGRALSLHEAGSVNGSTAILWDFIDVDDQRWHIVAVGNGFYKLINDRSGRALSTLNGGSTSGTIVHIWDYLTTFQDQQWAIERGSAGFVKILNRKGRRALSCLDGGTQNDTRVHLWDYLGAFEDQDWTIVPEVLGAKAATTQPGVSGMWRGFSRGSAIAGFTLDSAMPFKGLRSQIISYTSGDGEVGIENQSLNRWGMNVREGLPYRGYLYARTWAPTTIDVAFESSRGTRVFVEASLVLTGWCWTRYDFTLVPDGSDPHGRFAIKLKQPGSVAVGHVFVEPGAWGLFHGLPVRKDVGDSLVAQKNGVLRFGGSAVNSPTYRWTNMTGPRDLRPATRGFWYPFASNGWGIVEFLDFAEAAGVTGVPVLNMDETPEHVSDFIDYVNGSTSAVAGKMRADHGHPAPYNLRFVGLGNEETIDLSYWTRFRLLASAIWAKDPQIVLVVGDFSYDQVIVDPFKFTGGRRIATLEFHQKILDFAKANDREVWFDCHVWTDSVGEQDADSKVREQVAALHSLHTHLARISPGARFKLVVFELNADTHDLNRALANALAIGMMQRLGDEIHMVSSANALQPDDQNDNGWNQGLVFFNPRLVWGQPAYHVTRMIADHYQPLGVQATISGRESVTFDVTATKSADHRELVLQVVNTIDVARTYQIDLRGFEPRQTTARVTTLAGPRRSFNSAVNPHAVTPAQVDHPYQRVGNSLTFTFLPNSFTILRLH